MKLSSHVFLSVLVPAMLCDAYTFGGGYACGPRGNSVFHARMREMSPKQQAEYRRQQAQFVDQAFEALSKDLQKTRMNPDFIPQQKELVDKAVEFFTEMGSINRDDADNLRGITKKGFEIAQDIASGAYSPAYEIQDKETELEISLDVPGVAKADVDIVVEEGVLLKVSGTRNMGSIEEPKPVSFSRTFPVDETTDTDNILATLDSGVLVIRIPKKTIEKAPGKRIDIL
jgi:HSP20 family protein